MLLITPAGILLLILIVATFGHEFVRRGLRGSILLVWGLGQDLCLGLQHVLQLFGVVTLGHIAYSTIPRLIFQLGVFLFKVVAFPFVGFLRILMWIEAKLFSNRIRQPSTDMTVGQPAREPLKVQCSGMAAEKRCQRRSTTGFETPWFCKQHEGQAAYVLARQGQNGR